MYVEVEGIDAPLDYNLLLGRNWTYAISAIASTVFRVVVFPHEGKLVTIDQLDFTQKCHLESNEFVVPLVDQVKPAAQSLGVGMYTSLMGTFDLPAPVNYIVSTSVGLRADLGSIILSLHQQKTHSVGPFSNNLQIGYSLTRNSYGVPQKREYYCTFSL